MYINLRMKVIFPENLRGKGLWWLKDEWWCHRGCHVWLLWEYTTPLLLRQRNFHKTVAVSFSSYVILLPSTFPSHVSDLHVFAFFFFIFSFHRPSCKNAKKKCFAYIITSWSLFLRKTELTHHVYWAFKSRIWTPWRGMAFKATEIMKVLKERKLEDSYAEQNLTRA